MSARKFTIYIILLVALGLIGYDIYAASLNYQSTITYVFRESAKNHPSIPWGVGLIFGFWLGRATELKKHLQKVKK
jgi:hypothetical protein